MATQGGSPSTISFADFLDGGTVRDTGSLITDGGTVTSSVDADAWTQRWWGSLPDAYQRLDALQDPEDGAYPLLRFMDGPGRIGGEMRAISDALYAGEYANPATVPDGALRWLAQMLGVGPKQRDLPPSELRDYLQDLTESGRKVTGTRSAIAEVAKRYLLGRKQVQVGPSTTAAHTIIVFVRQDEVPNNDLLALAAKIKASGVVPAGHVVLARSGTTTWAQWEASTGTTWNDFEQTVTTWADSDSSGVDLE